MFSGKVIREGNLLNLVLSHGMSYALETWIVLKAIWYLILTNVVGDRGYWELISETYMINVALSKETYHFFFLIVPSGMHGSTAIPQFIFENPVK